MFEGIGDDGNVEAGLFHVKDGKADTVETDGTLFDDEVGEFFGEFEAVFPAAIEVSSLGADGGGIDMPLYDVAVEAAVHDHASFEVDQVAGLPGFQVGLVERLFDGGDPVGAFAQLFYSKADPVVGDALINFQFSGDGGFDPEGAIGAPGGGFADFSKRFDNSCKHGREFRKFIRNWASPNLYLRPGGRKYRYYDLSIKN